MPPGAARNALDCAFWDLEAKRAGTPGLCARGPAAAPQPLDDRLHDFARHGRRRWRRPQPAPPGRPLLKIKLGGPGDPERDRARCGRRRRSAELIVDANEGWTADNLAENLAACADGRRHAGRAAAAGRQPMRRSPRSRGRSRSAPTKACTTAPALAALVGRYDAVNIKLDKTGGLTEALAMAAEAERARLSA